MMTTIKSCTLLLMLCGIITFASCKKQNAVSEKTEDLIKPTYLPIGTIVDSTSFISAVVPRKHSSSKSGEKIGWIQDGSVFNPNWPGNGPQNPSGILSGSYTIMQRIALSTNGLYALDWQGNDQNLVLHQLGSYNGPIVKVLWATNKYNMNINKLIFDGEGNIIVQKTEWNGALTMVWQSGTGGHSNATNQTNMWIVQDDGNFVGYPMNTPLVGGISIGGAPFADTGTTGGRAVKAGRVNKIR